MFYKIRNAIILYVVIILAFIIQCTVFTRFSIFGASPNLLLIITFLAGYARGRVPGLLTGFFSGLCFDIFYSDVIGFNALTLLIIGYVSGIWNRYFYDDNLYVPLSLLAASDIFYSLVFYVFKFAVRLRFDIGYYLLYIIVPQFILTLIAGIILYIPLVKLFSRLSLETKMQ